MANGNIRLVYDFKELDKIIERLIKAKHLVRQTNRLLMEQFILLDELDGKRTASVQPDNPEDATTPGV